MKSDHQVRAGNSINILSSKQKPDKEGLMIMIVQGRGKQ